jgi:hypothetical protein
LPLAASTEFSNSNPSQQNQLVADLIAVETAREGEVRRSTHENHARSRQQFTKYLGSIGISHNVFLDSFTRSQQNKIIGTFAVALQQGQFLTKAHGTLALGTMKKNISDLSTTFRDNSSPNPTKDNNLQHSFILQ